jgi:mRNA interferase YafQ
MLTLEITGAFKRDFKRESNGAYSDVRQVLETALDALTNGHTLPPANRDHALKGKWIGYRNCHLKPDLILIYKKTKTTLALARLGSHSELF